MGIECEDGRTSSSRRRADPLFTTVSASDRTHSFERVALFNRTMSLIDGFGIFRNMTPTRGRGRGSAPIFSPRSLSGLREDDPRSIPRVRKKRSSARESFTTDFHSSSLSRCRTANTSTICTSSNLERVSTYEVVCTQYRTYVRTMSVFFCVCVIVTRVL